jgi:L-ascorbate metabolism protein UlaG (beta-lactamase superfamily)
LRRQPGECSNLLCRNPCMLQKVFGRKPAGKKLLQVQQSPNYKNGSFQNLSPTPVMAEDSSFWKTIKAYFNKPPDTRPPAPLPFVKTDLHQLSDKHPVIVWFGHSSYLLRINGYTILVDPVFSNHAAPFSFMVKAYPGADTYTVNDLPVIDLLVQTHDHYDHLDYLSITALEPKIKQVVTTLGTGSHFEYWGYNRKKIRELDWWQSTTPLEGLQLTALPGRHFSGRGIARGKTLWAGFALKTAGNNIFLGGDSGYDTHFKTIGDTHGPFDLAILECGQYDLHWPHIHMMPEETAQAAIDLRAKRLLPVHWAKFTLSLHPWNEPIKRLTSKAAELNIPLTTPMIGEPVVVGSHYPEANWWEL